MKVYWCSGGIAPRTGRFAPRERDPDTHSVNGWMGPRALDTRCMMFKLSCMKSSSGWKVTAGGGGAGQTLGHDTKFTIEKYSFGNVILIFNINIMEKILRLIYFYVTLRCPRKELPGKLRNHLYKKWSIPNTAQVRQTVSGTGSLELAKWNTLNRREPWNNCSSETDEGRLKLSTTTYQDTSVRVH